MKSYFILDQSKAKEREPIPNKKCQCGNRKKS